MAWWTNPDIQLKQKNRFVMSIGEFLIPTVVSVDKPKIQVESKEYTMINHVYRYPGIARWQPITVTFIDGSANSKDNQSNYIKNIDSLDAAQLLFNILTDSGYVSNSTVGGVTSKLGMNNRSFAKSVRIEQLEPNGTIVSEGWKLHNPIFTDISFGSLSYSDDSAVEYSVTIAYDWAEFYAGEDAALGNYVVSTAKSIRAGRAGKITDEEALRQMEILESMGEVAAQQSSLDPADNAVFAEGESIVDIDMEYAASLGRVSRPTAPPGKFGPF